MPVSTKMVTPAPRTVVTPVPTTVALENSSDASANNNGNAGNKSNGTSNDEDASDENNGDASKDYTGDATTTTAAKQQTKAANSRCMMQDANAGCWMQDAIDNQRMYRSQGPTTLRMTQQRILYYKRVTSHAESWNESYLAELRCRARKWLRVRPVAPGTRVVWYV